MVEDAVRERKVLAEELAKQVNALSDHKKELQSQLKQLQTQILEAEWTADKAIATEQERADKTIAEIKLSVAPYQDLKAQCEATKLELARLQQAKTAAVTEVKTARAAEIQAANEAVAKANGRLAKIEEAIAACKAKVASL